MRYPTNPAWEAVAAPAIAETRAWIAGRSFPADRPLVEAVPELAPLADAGNRLLARRFLMAKLVARKGKHLETLLPVLLK